MKKESVIIKIIRQIETKTVEELKALYDAETNEDIKKAIKYLITSKGE